MSALRDVVRDVALLVFDRAATNVRRRIGEEGEHPPVTRADLEAAVIELRYEQLVLICSQLDILRAEGERDLAAAQERARENAESVETVIVGPDGTEPTKKQF